MTADSLTKISIPPNGFPCKRKICAVSYFHDGAEGGGDVDQLESESKKRFFEDPDGHIRLDILMAWSQFGPDQHYVFDYIDALNHNHSSKVNAKRDSKGRPWVCIEELCRAIPCIRRGPHAVALDAGYGEGRAP